MYAALLHSLACLLALFTPADLDEPALTIDGAPVSFEEFACWLIPFQGESYVPDFVNLKLLERAAEAEGVTVTRERVLAQVEEQIAQRVATAFEGDAEAWRGELARLGQTEALHRAAKALSIYEHALASDLTARRRAVSQDRVRAAWEARYGPGGRRVELRWLKLDVPPPATPPGAPKHVVEELTRAARAQVEARALSLREQLEQGADFAALARAHSDEAHTRDTGGVPPEGFRLARLGKDAQEAVAGLGVGEVSAPVFGRGAYNLLQVAGETITPFETVSTELEAELLAEPTTAGESSELLAELRSEIAVEVLPEFAKSLRSGEPGPDPWRMQRPMLRVAGQLIPRAEFAGWLCASRGRPYVRTFAEMRLVETAAREAGVEVSSAEVDRRVYADLERSIERHFDGKRERWTAQLASNGLNEASWLRMSRVRARHDLLAERLLIAGRSFDESALRGEWETRYGPGGRSPDVRFLMRRVPEPAAGEVETQEELERYEQRARAEVVQLLESLRARMEAGEDFATLVELYSQDADTRDRGGRPAERFELHSWPTEVREAIEALRAGGITEPLQLGFQYYLFQLIGVRSVPFDEVREELLRELLEARPSMVDVRSFANSLFVQHEVTATAGLSSRQPGPPR